MGLGQPSWAWYPGGVPPPLWTPGPSPRIAPHGSYCGGYDSMAEIDIDLVSDTMAHLDAKLMDPSGNLIKTICTNEAYRYNSTSLAFEFPDIDSSDDCLRKMLAENGAGPHELKMIFDPEENSIDLDV